MDEELDGSELGTKEFWDKRYTMDLKNYKSHGDFGDIWFDESQDRIINWIKGQPSILKDARIIDIGSGNGMLLVELANEGYTNLMGVDYSPLAVQLANSIVTDQKLDERIEHKIINVLGEEGTDDWKALLALNRFQVVHDKGTYDAISLNPENPKKKRELYLRNIGSLIDDNGLLIMTSCNWSEMELVSFFGGSGELGLEVMEVIPTPTFKFGGKVGNVVSSVVFRKKT